jgi:uncharacterized membrane protein YedE/YeeE
LENKKRNRNVLFFSLGLLLLLIYGFFDPSSPSFFPKCPIKSLTSYDSPGCGSQRAVHALLHFQFIEAFKLNALLVISLPYLLIGFLFNAVNHPSEKILVWRERLFGHRAILVVLAVVICFGIGRNIL